MDKEGGFVKENPVKWTIPTIKYIRIGSSYANASLENTRSNSTPKKNVVMKEMKEGKKHSLTHNSIDASYVVPSKYILDDMDFGFRFILFLLYFVSHIGFSVLLLHYGAGKVSVLCRVNIIHCHQKQSRGKNNNNNNKIK